MMTINEQATEIDPDTIVKVLGTTFFADLDWEDPANAPLAALFSFTDELKELEEQAASLRREFTDILTLCVQERINGGMAKEVKNL